MKTHVCSALLGLGGLAVPATAASVIVNEINCKDLGATPSGDWFEVVVVGDGTAFSSVDMRGWQFRVDNKGTLGDGYFKLSLDGYWSNVRAGTILTFSETNAGPVGAPTSIFEADNFSSLGWAHSNIYVQDATYIDTGWGSTKATFSLDKNSTQVVIQNASGADVFGPAGEGVYPASGVGATDVFKLQGDPSALITPGSTLYAAGSTDTFGRPNEWSSGAFKQSFAAFVPEPSVSWLAVGGLSLLGLRRRKPYTA
jgi:hypothetical protein